MTVNKVILIGNLGRDPEIRTTASGTSVGNLRIATSERRRDRDGNWNDHTEWHTVVCFGKTAENAGRFLKKGRQVFIEGRLQTRKWQDQSGADRYTTEIVANEMQMLDSRSSGQGGQPQQRPQSQQKPQQSQQKPQQAAVGFDAEDDIPF